MTAPSRAIYLSEGGHLSIIARDSKPVPTGSQTLIEVKYSAVNPADLRHAYMGLHSFVAGYEWAGTVVAVGPESPYAVGEALFGQAPIDHQKPLSQGAHQDYLLAETEMTFRLPEDMKSDSDGKQHENDGLTQVVGWPIGLQTVADALVNPMGFGFPALPSLVEGEDPRGQALLIWGGASTLGLTAIQLAKAMGFSPILTTASPANHETLLALGATRCFDYRAPDVVAEIRAAVSASGQTLRAVFDAVAVGTGFAEPPRSAAAAAAPELDFGRSSPALAKRCLSDGVSPGRARLVASLVVAFDPDWQICLPVRPVDNPITASLMGGKAVPVGWDARIQAVTAWVLKNHAAIGFRLPRVTVVEGAEEGIQAIRDVFAGRASMQKFVIKHPM